MLSSFFFTKLQAIWQTDVVQFNMQHRAENKFKLYISVMEIIQKFTDQIKGSEIIKKLPYPLKRKNSK